MQQAGYHHANVLASQMRSELQVRNTEVLLMLQTISDNSTVTETPSVAVTDTSTLTESLNITTQQTTQLEILKLLREMQTNFRGNNNQRSRTGGGRGSGGRGRGNATGNQGGRGEKRIRKTPDNADYHRP